MLDRTSIPAHIAIIMDGNGRWAKKRRLPVAAGHNAGLKAMKKIVKHSSKLGLKHLTVYAFSTENWKRSEEEIKGIFNLLVKYVDWELKELCANDVRVRILGDYSVLPNKVNQRVKKMIEETKTNKGLQLNIALNYGGREEIRRAVKSIASDAAAGKLGPDSVTDEIIEKRLYTGEEDVPDPELLIRTSGEMRLSNYLLWQCAYSEFVFTDALWPDFTPEEYDKVIETYQSRNRRFGGR